MSEAKPTNVRFSDKDRKRIEKAAKEIGMTYSSDFVKFATRTLLDYIDENGVEALKPNWKKILHDLDGRTHRYSKIQVGDIESQQTVIEGNITNKGSVIQTFHSKKSRRKKRKKN